MADIKQYKLIGQNRKNTFLIFRGLWEDTENSKYMENLTALLHLGTLQRVIMKA